MGVINFIRANAAANCDDFSTNATYAGTTWAASGQTWLDNLLEQIFRYGATEKLALVGSGFLLGIQALAMAGATIQITPGQTDCFRVVLE